MKPQPGPRREAGVALHKAGRLEDARQVYSEILAETPDDPNTLHLLGLTCLAQAGQAAPAAARGLRERGMALIERAIQRLPGQALFHFNLGVGYRNHGELARARSCFHQAITLDPGHGEAWGAYTETGRYTESGPDLDKVLRQIPRARDAANRQHLHFAAAKILDDVGDYDRAFQHFREANALARRPWDAGAYRALCRATRALFTADFFDARRDWGLEEAAPIFIVGMPRSGSSLLEQMLASHAQVAGVGEIPDIPSIVEAVSGRLAPGRYPADIGRLPRGDFAGFAAAYARRLQTLTGSAALRAVDKNLRNFLYVGLIRVMFPRARIIHCRRHPLDTALSCFFQNFAGGQEFSFKLENIVQYHQGYRELLAHWQAFLPGSIYEIGYELLVANPETSLRGLLEYCDLPWDSACLEHATTRRSVATASSWQVRQPLYQRSLARWRNYEKHLGPLRELLV